MKRIYHAPETCRFRMDLAQMVTASSDVDRTQSGLDLPGNVKKSSDEVDEGLGNGQEDGIRGKEFDLWDISAFSIWE